MEFQLSNGFFKTTFVTYKSLCLYKTLTIVFLFHFLRIFNSSQKNFFVMSFLLNDIKAVPAVSNRSCLSSLIKVLEETCDHVA